MRRLLCATLMTSIVGSTSTLKAQPTLDGTRDASYVLRSVQTVETQFGDANPNNGSELDAAWINIHGGTLYLLLTGNLENNFNKLNIFVDSVAGGQNVLANDANNGGTNPENNGWAGKHAGLTFDVGFEADYLLILRNGNFGGDRFDVDFATIGGGLGAFQAATDVFGGSLTGSNGAALPNGIGVAFDRSNTAGVEGCNTPAMTGCQAADQLAAAAVTTGIELAIPLSTIGSPNPLNVKISAMVNGSNHDFLSNQSLAGLPAGTGNLGGDGAGTFTGVLAGINFNNFAGDQFFIVVPEPGSALLAAIALATLAASPLSRKRPLA